MSYFPKDAAGGGVPELDSNGLVPTDNLGSGVADGTKILYGDQTWDDPPSGLAASDLAYYVQQQVYCAPYNHSGYNFDRDVLYGRAYGSANGDWIEWSVLLAPGQYTLQVWYYRWDNGGIFDVSIDGGASEGSVDTYDAVGQTPNNAAEVTGITISGGRHTIRFTTNGKNASSADYFVLLCGEWSLRRTGA